MAVVTAVEVVTQVEVFTGVEVEVFVVIEVEVLVTVFVVVLEQSPGLFATRACVVYMYTVGEHVQIPPDVNDVVEERVLVVHFLVLGIEVDEL